MRSLPDRRAATYSQGMESFRTIRGVRVPAMFYGTAWKEARTAELTAQALRAGFRAIDTANQRKHYFEAGVGEGIARAVSAGDVTREALFLQTKFTYARGQDHRLPYDPSASFEEQVGSSVKRSLEHLGTTYIDAYVLHGPERGDGISTSDLEVWRAMESHVETGTLRLLGVSNVSLDQLTALYRAATVKPAFVQNRCYARTSWDAEVRAFCRDHDVIYQGFSLLTANARELASEQVRTLAARHGKTTAQVVMRFALGVGMIPLTGTTSEAHMRDDLDATTFELSARELALVERIAF